MILYGMQRSLLPGGRIRKFPKLCRQYAVAQLIGLGGVRNTGKITLSRKEEACVILFFLCRMSDYAVKDCPLELLYGDSV